MELIRLCSDGAAERAGASVVALGCFDGLHIGHQALLHSAAEEAKRLGLPLVVYSPEAKKGQALLFTPKEKTEKLYELGCDRVILADFDPVIAEGWTVSNIAATLYGGNSAGIQNFLYIVQVVTATHELAFKEFEVPLLPHIEGCHGCGNNGFGIE